MEMNESFPKTLALVYLKIETQDAKLFVSNTRVFIGYDGRQHTRNIYERREDDRYMIKASGD
jgi:hypothetical protein